MLWKVIYVYIYREENQRSSNNNLIHKLINMENGKYSKKNLLSFYVYQKSIHKKNVSER